jgi:hypothetical protein
MDAFGFDRAARLYRQAIALIGAGDARRRLLHEKLGVALGTAHRGPEAAAAYLDAALGAGTQQALELRRRAADHYLLSGHIEEGLVVLRAVLAATGMTMPATPLGALLRMVPLLVLLWWRGLRFRERAESELPAEELLRIDACAAVSRGLSVAEPFAAAYFQERFLRLALRAGEPRRVLRALTYEALFVANRGREVPSPFEERLHQSAIALAERLGDPGFDLRVARGAVLVVRTRFREAREQLEQAEAELRESGAGFNSEFSLSRICLIQALLYLGEWKELARRQEAFIEDARARGDLMLEVVLSSLTGHVSALLQDRPDEARDVVDRAETLWARVDHFQAYGRLTALSATELYREAGVGEGALALVLERRPALARSPLRFNLVVRTHLLAIHGSALLAAAARASPPRREELSRAVARDTRALVRLDTRLARAFAPCLRAWMAVSSGDRGGACEMLREAETGFEALDMALYAAASRRRRGELLAGEEGRALVASADAEMVAQEIRNPARMTAMFLPGTW